MRRRVAALTLQSVNAGCTWHNRAPSQCSVHMMPPKCTKHSKHSRAQRPSPAGMPEAQPLLPHAKRSLLVLFDQRDSTATPHQSMPCPQGQGSTMSCKMWTILTHAPSHGTYGINLCTVAPLIACACFFCVLQYRPLPVTAQPQLHCTNPPGCRRIVS